MILICYDGSPNADEAIDRAAELFDGAATVLTVWESFVDVMARTGSGLGYGPGAVDVQSIDEASRQSAVDTAEAGAERAREAGLEATAVAAEREQTIADTVLSRADLLKAETVVIGTRGLAGLKSLLLGSVSHAVVQHADRPVLVVPSGEVAAARRA